MTPSLTLRTFSSCLICGLLLIFGCSQKDSAPPSKKGGMKFPVEVATVSTRSGNLAIQAVGSIEAFEVVQITSRVIGAVEKVNFKEGEVVKAGDPLAEIEPERFDLAVKSAEAAYERSKAALREAQAGLTRRMDIQSKNPGFVSPEDMDSWQTKAQSALADSIEASTALETAKLNLRYAFVPAPISGIIQSRSIRTGDYVQLGTLVATMVRRDPLLLRFTVQEQDAQRLKQGLDVQFTVRGETDEYHARITAVADFADDVTRMVAVTAEVTDPKKDALRPGAFAEVTVLLGDAQDLPVIPQISIRPSEKGFLAYVVQDSVAKERVLTLGLQSPDGFVEVKDGLKSGERIVVRGAEPLSDGAAVKIISPNDSTGSKRKAGKNA